MDTQSMISPEDSFPEDLNSLPAAEVEVLNSRIHRALDSEYLAFGMPNPETECRKEFLTEELDRRDAAALTDASTVIHTAKTG